mmetsp:Transcript_63019/g.113413  ORF Transcript_63019/g.113413 Transcript_63019/m.113413 type:complete len:226 (+) Transcript_63019:1145-1822(+)
MFCPTLAKDKMKVPVASSIASGWIGVEPETAETAEGGTSKVFATSRTAAGTSVAFTWKLSELWSRSRRAAVRVRSSRVPTMNAKESPMYSSELPQVFAIFILVAPALPISRPNLPPAGFRVMTVQPRPGSSSEARGLDETKPGLLVSTTFKILSSTSIRALRTPRISNLWVVAASAPSASSFLGLTSPASSSASLSSNFHRTLSLSSDRPTSKTSASNQLFPYFP